jgi:Alpha/beta hydrolase family
MSYVPSADGTAIAFERLGNGPPLVLVGGTFRGRSDPKMVQIAQLLAAHHTVLNYDRRGRADSGDSASDAIKRELEDLKAVIGVAGGSASVFGMSSGAVLALEAGAHGLAVEKLALYEPPADVDYALPAERVVSVAVPTLLIVGENVDARLRRAAQALWTMLPDVQHRVLPGQTPDVDPRALAPLLERFFAGSARGMWAASGRPLV